MGGRSSPSEGERRSPSMHVGKRGGTWRTMEKMNKIWSVGSQEYY